MPTVAELQRLEALVGRLTPLANVQRGELIRAEIWNVAVGALIEVARAVLAEERESIVPLHEHPDQVSLGWLDPRLRSLVERGPLADPAAAATVSDLERQLVRLGDRIDQVDDGVQEVRDRVSEVSTRDLAREAEVTSVRRTIEGISDSRDDVLALRQTLGSIQQDLSVAVEAGELLVVDGEPVDMADVVGRIRNVEVLRERLTTPSGELLDASALEERLTELTNTLVTEEELDAALESRRAQVSPEQIEELKGELRSDLNQGLETSRGRLAEEIRAEMSERLAEVDALVARAVADALPGLQESVLGQVRPEITSAVQGGMEETQAIFERRLGETGTALREDFANQIEDVKRNVAAAVSTEFERQLPSHLDPIRTDMEALSDRVERIDARLAQHDETLGIFGTRMETIAREADAARTELQQTLMGEMDRRDQERTRDLDARFLQADEATSDRIDAALADFRSTLEEEVRRVASDAASEEARAIENRLLGEMHAVARDEIAALQDQLRSMVATEVEQAFAGVADLVSEEVRRAVSDQLPELAKEQLGRLTEERLKELLANELVLESLRPLIHRMVEQAVDDRLG